MWLFFDTDISRYRLCSVSLEEGLASEPLDFLNRFLFSAS